MANVAVRANTFRRPSRAVCGTANTRARLCVTQARLLATSTIPAFIPRSDLLEQLQRWLELEVVNDGQTNFGVPCRMDLVKREDELWGFLVHMEEEGKDPAIIKLTLDEELCSKFAFIGQDERGMPSPMGEETEVLGANFEFWKEDDNPTDDDQKTTIKVFCNSVAEALNRYYAFGHVFSEEW